MKKNRFTKVALFMLLQLMFSLWTFGQSLLVQGTVTDETGVPLVGVNVAIQGTTMGTITDVNGNYQIEAVSGSTLTFSFVGYLSESVVVETQTTVNITLVPDVTQLEDVVVVGYGTQKKETLTGSVVNVSGKEIEKSPSSNLASSLAGRLPGLIVSQRSGEPGRDDPEMLIRGTGTFDLNPNDGINSNAPLIIIDGVERSMMSRLNPEDIESLMDPNNC